MLKFEGPLTVQNVKYKSSNNEACLVRPHINFEHSNLDYYPFTISLGKSGRVFKNLVHLSIRLCVQNKTKDVKPKLFNMITGIDESNQITKTYLIELKLYIRW